MNDILTGTYFHSIDAKGRMNFPTKLLDILGASFYVTRCIDKKCLTVYSNEEWQKLSEKINMLPESKCMPVKRFLFSGACELIPDKQGRILLPQNLRNFADFKKDVVVIGIDNKAEIWDKDLWDEYENSFNTADIAGLMDSLGL